ncbi:MAG: hypothetical protein OQK57_07700 [Ignavibacteriaceae bacterium]|nr:hypothetical protein [Ignavibacteriaceae bacterium]
MFKYLILILYIVLSSNEAYLYCQDEEPILYFQMEPLDDSLFIKIQQELFIDPPDPKAEIVVDVRNPNDQTLSVKGSLYPFLALNPELRAQIINYPFKINLEETIHYASVFTDVINKLRFDKIINTPSVFQISPTLGYINPFIQFMGGERFGFSLKKDIGFSFGLGTPYSGALETNYYEINFHILGLKAGIISNDDTFIEHKFDNNHNNIYFANTYHISYVVPFGNFFEFGYLETMDEFNETKIKKYYTDNLVFNQDGTIKYDPYLVQGKFYNWEFRYPIKILESTRGKVYVAKFVNELHIGITGREMSLAGSVFDFRFDAMVSSKQRQPQYVLDLMVQKVFDYWAFSVIAVGPSIVLGTTNKDKFGVTSGFVNLRIKVGSSL